ncbi:MAG TPA: hypothetical protein DCY35_00315 [Prolixibacteraceae bacterium]|nr:hypothetical protein [Prolixibacteraceae bacterium]
MDSFTGAFVLNIEEPWSLANRYQRAVDFMTAEVHVDYNGTSGTVRRSFFVSRADDVIVIRIKGSAKQTASFTFSSIPAISPDEARALAKRVRHKEQGVKDDYLYFSRIFEANETNPVRGYEGLGKLIAKGGRSSGTSVGRNPGLRTDDADEILLLIRISPLLKDDNETSNISSIARELDALPDDYDELLERHAKIHSDLMGRVSLSLNAPEIDRAKPTDELNEAARTTLAPLAQIERAFDAGRYHVICSTGYNPPNLQGLWSASVLAPWRGDFHMNADLQSSISFLCMGNTLELMESFFCFHEKYLPDYRTGMQDLYGMRGFFVPCAMTTRGRLTHFNSHWPFPYYYTAAAWTCQFYYDYWQYTGDQIFLKNRAYPMLKELAAFYEDFLTITDKKGHVVFVPSYSSEQGERDGTGACINSAMDIGAAKQVLNHAIKAAQLLGCDSDLCIKWKELLSRMPPYEVGEDGFFREWVWPGRKEENDHRHASHLYPLYDEMPAEITESPELVQAVRNSCRARMDYHEKVRWWSPGAIFVGWAAAHTLDPDVVERVINYCVRDFWGTGMNSFCNKDELFQIDASGSFPKLCASALVYSEQGIIRFFPARPAQWQSGSIQGLRLRGAITLKALTWNSSGSKAILVSDKDQTTTIITPGEHHCQCELKSGKAFEFNVY